MILSKDVLECKGSIFACEDLITRAHGPYFSRGWRFVNLFSIGHFPIIALFDQ